LNEQPAPRVGGIVHRYQKFDPLQFPSPTQPPPDLVSPMMEHMLAYGNMKRLTPEELARAIRLNPEQFASLGPNLDRIRDILLERKKKILETYETRTVQQAAANQFVKSSKRGPQPPEKLRKAYRIAVEEEQLFDFEQLYYRVGDDTDPFARHLVTVMDALGNKYQIDELAAKYHFTGQESLTIPRALEIKQELEKIDELLKQIEEAAKNAQLAVIDLSELSEFIESQDLQQLEDLRRIIDDYMQAAAAQQGLLHEGGKFQLTPQAYRIFQGKLLERIFSHLQPGRSGRHDSRIVGEGAVELPATKPYEFGDSVTQLDIPQSFVNALIRSGGKTPIQLHGDDLVVHKTKNNPKCASVVIMDMSGSMRYDGQYVHVKRMALALDGLIRSEYPGDYLGFIEMYTFAKVRQSGEIATLMPKPVTIHEPIVQLRVDMAQPQISEHMVHQHFTNIQQSLNLSRRLLANQDTPNRQVILITDGLPTAHYDQNWLYMLYPPHPLTEQITMAEALRCAQEGITINIFLIPSWSQTNEDVQFAQRLAQSTRGRVFFTGGEDLDRFVVWDYVNQKREIIG
jgi:uncharacterized protein with von Willebrand factor type A (vWA) domain